MDVDILIEIKLLVIVKINFNCKFRVKINKRLLLVIKWGFNLILDLWNGKIIWRFVGNYIVCKIEYIY